jgi:hypothetical protein
MGSLGVELTSHKLGVYVHAVPIGSLGDAIGLKEGDVITKAGIKGHVHYPVKHFNDTDRVMYLLQNEDKSGESPVIFTIWRGEIKDSKESAAEWSCTVCGNHNRASKLACDRCSAPNLTAEQDTWVSGGKPGARPRSSSASTIDSARTSGRPRSSSESTYTSARPRSFSGSTDIDFPR